MLNPGSPLLKRFILEKNKRKGRGGWLNAFTPKLKFTNISRIKIFLMILKLVNREGKSSLHSTVNCVWWNINISVGHERYAIWEPNCIEDHILFWNFDFLKMSVYHVHNSALDSKSSFNASSLIKSFDWLGEGNGSRSSPKICAVNLLASKSRSGHSGTIRLAP